MASYKLELKPSALRELRGFPREVIVKLSKAIEGLSEDPFPHQSQKLSGSVNAYRLRVADYRIIYTVEKDASRITVVRIVHRREVYRKR